MNKNDILTIFTIANDIKYMWQLMTYIEEIINTNNHSMLEPFFHRFIRNGYKINDMCINIADLIDKNATQTKDFFEDIIFIIIKLNYLIEKNILFVSRNILIVFKEFKKRCEEMFYWDHESYIRVQFEIYSA